MLSQSKFPLLFIGILAGLFFYYDYHEILFKRPQSVHYWRQADCASLALNYYQGGMDFFHPEVHNLTSDNFTTGYTSTSEMPLLYYTVAILYQVFGYHEFLFRLLNVLIFFTGLYYLYKLFYNLLRHQFWAMCLPLLLFSSPVLAYYANNFLSNSAALGLVFIAWFHFIEYYRNKEIRDFRISVIFFTIAGLLKITALLSIGAIFVVFLLEKSLFRNSVEVFPAGWKYLSSFLLCFVVVASWTAYATLYNQEHGSSYFSTTTFPIWDMTADEIRAVKDNVFKLWFGQYFNKALWMVWFASVLILSLFRKRAGKFYLLTCVLLLAGAWAYLALQFATLKDHDYYTINLFIIPVLLLIALFDLIKAHFSFILRSKIAVLAAIAFTLYNVNYAKAEVNDRYSGWWNNYGEKNDIEDITPFLRGLGIKPSDKVISIPDQSHLTLYLMNQKGWTENAERFFNQGSAVYLNRDHSGMESSIANGAKYLIINGLDALYERPFLQQYAIHLLGKFRQVMVFDLTRLAHRNFVLPNRQVKEVILCNAEAVTPDGEGLVAQHGSRTFGGAVMRSEEYAYSGEHCVKLDTKHRFGMTLTLDKVLFGESFIISVMRRKGPGGMDLVATGKGNPQFYLSEAEVSKTDDPDWGQMSMEFHIPEKMDGRALSVYLWNHGEASIYADDLKIVWFQSYFKSQVN